MVDPLKVQPIGPWFLVKVEPLPEKTAGGILLPRPLITTEERLGHTIGQVLKVGTGKLSKKGRRISYGIEPGDRVVFRWYLHEINRPGQFYDKEFCLIHGDDIQGVVEE